MNLFKIISNLPIPKTRKLEWHRSLLHRKYSADIKLASKGNDKEKAASLQRDLRFEMEMHEEDEDNYYTKILLRKARQLRVPLPHRKTESGEESEFWYQGHYTGGWYLTNTGISKLRQEIRSEINARHEIKSKWAIWVSALTGVVGAITGLVAVLSKVING